MPLSEEPRVSKSETDQRGGSVSREHVKQQPRHGKRRKTISK